jgi:hypothetical protein
MLICSVLFCGSANSNKSSIVDLIDGPIVKNHAVGVVYTSPSVCTSPSGPCSFDRSALFMHTDYDIGSGSSSSRSSYTSTSSLPSESFPAFSGVSSRSGSTSSRPSLPAFSGVSSYSRSSSTSSLPSLPSFCRRSSARSVSFFPAFSGVFPAFSGLLPAFSGVVASDVNGDSRHDHINDGNGSNGSDIRSDSEGSANGSNGNDSPAGGGKDHGKQSTGERSEVRSEQPTEPTRAKSGLKPGQKDTDEIHASYAEMRARIPTIKYEALRDDLLSNVF